MRNDTEVFLKARVYVTLLFILTFFSSPFILPHYIINYYQNGPQLGFYFMISGFALILAIYLGISLVSKTKIGIKLTLVDYAVGLSFTFVLLRNLFLNEPLLFTNKLQLYICLNILYWGIRYSVSFFDQRILPLFSILLVAISLGLLLISCSTGLFQLYGVIAVPNPDFVVTGHFFNPAVYANYIVALAPFCISAYFLYPKDARYFTLIKYASIITGLIGILVLPITYCRAAWIAIGATCFLIVLLKYRHLLSGFYKYKIRAVLVFVLLFSAFFFLFRIKVNSALGRLDIWKISINIVKKHPLSGIGYGKFEGEYIKYQGQFFAQNKTEVDRIGRSDVIRFPYNICLQILCEQGVIGLTIFFFLLYSLYRSLRSVLEKKDEFGTYLAITIFSSEMAIIICGQFSYPFDIVPVLIVFFVNAGLMSGLSEPIKLNHTITAKFKKGFRKPSPGSVAFAVFLCCISIAVFDRAKTRHDAYKRWMYLFSNGKGSAQLSSIYPVLQDDNEFVVYYTEQLFKEKKYGRIIEVLEEYNSHYTSPYNILTIARAYAAVNQKVNAENNFLLAVNMLPNRFENRFLLARFYYENNMFDKAIEISNEILNMRIKVPSVTADDIKKKAKVIFLDSQRRINAL
jgi:O-antigen polymerase